MSGRKRETLPTGHINEHSTFWHAHFCCQARVSSLSGFGSMWCVAIGHSLHTQHHTHGKHNTRQAHNTCKHQGTLQLKSVNLRSAATSLECATYVCWVPQRACSRFHPAVASLSCRVLSFSNQALSLFSSRQLQSWPFCAAPCGSCSFGPLLRRLAIGRRCHLQEALRAPETAPPLQSLPMVQSCSLAAKMAAATSTTPTSCKCQAPRSRGRRCHPRGTLQAAGVLTPSRRLQMGLRCSMAA